MPSFSNGIVELRISGAAGRRKSDGRSDADDAMHAAIGLTDRHGGGRGFGRKLVERGGCVIDPPLQHRHKTPPYPGQAIRRISRLIE